MSFWKVDVDDSIHYSYYQWYNTPPGFKYILQYLYTTSSIRKSLPKTRYLIERSNKSTADYPRNKIKILLSFIREDICELSSTNIS